MIFETMIGMLLLGSAMLVSAGIIAVAIKEHAHALYRIGATLEAREHRERLKEGWTHGNQTKS